MGQVPVFQLQKWIARYQMIEQQKFLYKEII